MEGIISFGNKRSYDDFKKQIPNSVLPLFDSIREFCFSLGENVVEDVRMHRVVFCKSMTFRWFVDVEPQREGVIIKIQKNRKEPVQIIQIKKDQLISEFNQMLKVAFEEIH
jgi:predicted transport protein